MPRFISAEIISLPEKTVLLATVGDAVSLRTQLAAAVADIAALRASIVGVNAKLDLDAGVTDTNYSALWNPAAQTSVTPAAATILP